MKKIIAIAAAAALAATATPTHAASSEMVNEWCPLVEQLAEQTMTNRQNGVPMSELMQRSEGTITNIPLRNLVRKVIIMAYETTRWSTESLRQKEIERFTNMWSVACYKQAKD